MYGRRNTVYSENLTALSALGLGISIDHLQRGHQQIELVLRHAVGIQLIEHAPDTLFEQVNGTDITENKQGQAGKNAVSMFFFSKHTLYRVQCCRFNVLKTINQTPVLYLYILRQTSSVECAFQ